MNDPESNEKTVNIHVESGKNVSDCQKKPSFQGELFDNPLFKDSATLQVIFSPTLADKESGFPRICHGLWCFLYNLPAMGHMGSTQGFTSLLLFDPYQAFGTVILTNKQWENTFIEEIAQIVFGVNE